MGDRLFGSFKLVEPDQGKTEVDPSGRGDSVLADLVEDSAGVLPRLPLGIYDSKALLQEGIFAGDATLDSQGVDITFFGIKEVSGQEEGVSSQDVGLLCLGILSKEFVQASRRSRVVLLENSDFSLHHKELLTVFVKDVVEGNISNVKDVELEQEGDQLEEQKVRLL